MGGKILLKLIDEGTSIKDTPLALPLKKPLPKNSFLQISPLGLFQRFTITQWGNVELKELVCRGEGVLGKLPIPFLLSILSREH